ncbi:MAG: hypothetical protein ACK4Z6_01080 [Candidatus Methylomirabilales bacterium]
MYMRYHYAVDVLAGILLAVLCLVLSPRLYTWLAGAPSSPLP